MSGQSASRVGRTRAAQHQAQQTADEHHAEVQRLDSALVSLATNLAEGLVDPSTYSTARAGLLDRRDAASRDLQHAEAELARLAPLPDDAHDRLVTLTENTDMAETWSQGSFALPRRTTPVQARCRSASRSFGTDTSLSSGVRHGGVRPAR